MSRNTKAVLLIATSFWGMLIGMGYLAFQYWQTQQKIQVHSSFLEDFSQDFEEKKNFYKNNIARSMKQMEANVERNPEGQIYLDEVHEFRAEHLQPYNKLLSGMMKELREDKKISRESLGIWKYELDDFKAALKKYNDHKIYFKRQKLFDKCSYEFEEIKERIDDFREVNDTLIWKSFLQDCLLKNQAIEFEIAEIGRSNVSVEIICGFHWKDIAIIPSAKTLRYGEEFEAQVFMIGSEFPHKLESIKINDKEFSFGAAGRAEYKTKPSIGRHTINAEITYRDGFRKLVTLTKRLEYEVLPKCK